MSSYRKEIDGLRAIAVCGVIVGHTNNNLLPSGYLGVDVFFVISGFVISASLARMDCSSGLDFIARFYARRIKRLVPALAFFVAVTALAITLVDEFPRRSLLTGAWSMLGLSNIFLATQAADYFAPTSDLNGFVHTWSLGVEEQFYLIFPFLFWLLSKRKGPNSQGLTLFLTISVLSALSLAVFARYYDQHQAYIYFLMPSRFWELGAGVATYFLSIKSSWITDKICTLPPAIPFALVMGIFCSPEQFAVANTIFIVVATGLLILSLREQTLTYAFLTTRPMLFLGLISYSLYLWHWGVLVIARLTVGVTLSTTPALFAVMGLLGTVSYFLVERPLRYRSWTLTRRGEIGVGLTMSGFVMVLTYGILLAHPKVNLATLLGYDTSHIRKTWWTDRVSGEYLELCHVENVYSTKLLNQCIPKTGDQPRSFIIGDSHARNYLETIRSSLDGYNVSYLTMGHHCAYLPESMAANFDHVSCRNYVREVTERIRETVQPGDVVFIGQRLLENPDRYTPEYFDFLASQSEIFIEQGARVVIMDGTYPPTQMPRFCLDLPWRPQRDGCSVSESAVQSAYVEFDQRAGDLAEANGSIFYVSLRASFCEDGVCGSRTTKGTSIWHDVGHITDTVALELVPHLKQQLANNGFFE